MLLIPGTSSVAHLEENLAAADVELDESDLAELEHATQLGIRCPPPTTDARGSDAQRVASAARVASSAGA